MIFALIIYTISGLNLRQSAPNLVSRPLMRQLPQPRKYFHREMMMMMMMMMSYFIVVVQVQVTYVTTRTRPN